MTKLRGNQIRIGNSIMPKHMVLTENEVANLLESHFHREFKLSGHAGTVRATFRAGIWIIDVTERE